MNNNPTSEKLTFRELISMHKIEIPIIQRDYAQGREGKADIRTNFLNALLEVVDGKKLELDFVYGSVKKDKEGNTTLQPLDGQQRLTTLFLLHWFVATKENKLDDELKKLLTKFTYETRTSSREFCNDLINKGIDFDNLLETDYHDKEKIKPKNNELSKTIIDSSWFFLSWKRDPTIKSMLRMLDAIQQTFQDKTEVWDKLNNISFHYIELQNFGLSDDLYIKMNARGKPLTDFENFKAKFEQYIKQNDWENYVEPTETFSHQIDTLWTDLFWNYRDKTENIFDEQLLNFFRTKAVINYTLKADIKSNNFRANVDLLRGSDTISFNQYLELGCFDEEYFTTLKATLNKLSDKDGLNTFISETTYVNEQEIFNGTIKNDLSYPDLVIAFAYYQYLASEKNIEIEKLKSWLRVVRNLVEGSRPYLFNNANEFANALRSINELLQYRNSIVDHFAEIQINSLSGFISEQIIEEKLKAKLITQNEDWKNTIIEIENHKYFNGQIGFLLHWCQINDEPNLNSFKEYAEKSKAIFGTTGLNNFENFLFERALLAIGDYLLSKGRNHSFIIDNERDISWKRLLRDNNEKRAYLKQLVDKVSVLNLTIDLQKIVDEFSDKNDWRYYFIKQFEMISACGNQKLIRWDSEFDILLLGSTTTSGYHNEYYSYSLFIELKTQNRLTDISYYPQRSVNDWKFFELNYNQIAFDCNSSKYVCTQNNDWYNKQEFENRNSVFDYIIELNTEDKLNEKTLS
ncbi:hypothetical protein CMU68_07870 [Elizabethkingia anophelis]|uniref:DUF262 domain-containing protein n=1 Tax=Sphingobacterium TaxID=28453 RepID=UPI00293CE077|nr:hypothetical protein [Elizabethkingia anophelis]MDV3678860.1 hypothetical protein [Elizabethkingia anophelis]|tara:strand:+ start:9751 stop:11985 length:2235 start_codon:yes stop_codon:yes gene_type:complete